MGDWDRKPHVSFQRGVVGGDPLSPTQVWKWTDIGEWDCKPYASFQKGFKDRPLTGMIVEAQKKWDVRL